MLDGCRWQQRSFKVNMTDRRIINKQYSKCDRCKNSDTKVCKGCKKQSKFVDRGFVLIVRKAER